MLPDANDKARLQGSVWAGQIQGELAFLDISTNDVFPMDHIFVLAIFMGSLVKSRKPFWWDSVLHFWNPPKLNVYLFFEQSLRIGRTKKGWARVAKILYNFSYSDKAYKWTI